MKEKFVRLLVLMLICGALSAKGGDKKDEKAENAESSERPENSAPGMKDYKQLYSLEDEFMGIIKDRMLEVKNMKQKVFPAQNEIRKNLDRAINVLEAWDSANDYVPI